ncbi:hypothetical protein H0H93_010985, partial [Arthromyces matolae]
MSFLSTTVPPQLESPHMVIIAIGVFALIVSFAFGFPSVTLSIFDRLHRLVMTSVNRLDMFLDLVGREILAYPPLLKRPGIESAIRDWLKNRRKRNTLASSTDSLPDHTSSSRVKLDPDLAEMYLALSSMVSELGEDQLLKLYKLVAMYHAANLSARAHTHTRVSDPNSSQLHAKHGDLRLLNLINAVAAYHAAARARSDRSNVTSSSQTHHTTGSSPLRSDNEEFPEGVHESEDVVKAEGSVSSEDEHAVECNEGNGDAVVLEVIEAESPEITPEIATTNSTDPPTEESTPEGTEDNVDCNLEVSDAIEVDSPVDIHSEADDMPTEATLEVERKEEIEIVEVQSSNTMVTLVFNMAGTCDDQQNFTSARADLDDSNDSWTRVTRKRRSKKAARELDAPDHDTLPSEATASRPLCNADDQVQATLDVVADGPNPKTKTKGKKGPATQKQTFRDIQDWNPIAVADVRAPKLDLDVDYSKWFIGLEGQTIRSGTLYDLLVENDQGESCSGTDLDEDTHLSPSLPCPSIESTKFAAGNLRRWDDLPIKIDEDIFNGVASKEKKGLVNGEDDDDDAEEEESTNIPVELHNKLPRELESQNNNDVSPVVVTSSQRAWMVDQKAKLLARERWGREEQKTVTVFESEEQLRDAGEWYRISIQRPFLGFSDSSSTPSPPRPSKPIQDRRNNHNGSQTQRRARSQYAGIELLKPDSLWDIIGQVLPADSAPPTSIKSQEGKRTTTASTSTGVAVEFTPADSRVALLSSRPNHENMNVTVVSGMQDLRASSEGPSDWRIRLPHSNPGVEDDDARRTRKDRMKKGIQSMQTKIAGLIDVEKMKTLMLQATTSPSSSSSFSSLNPPTSALALAPGPTTSTESTDSASGNVEVDRDDACADGQEAVENIDDAERVSMPEGHAEENMGDICDIELEPLPSSDIDTAPVISSSSCSSAPPLPIEIEIKIDSTDTMINTSAPEEDANSNSNFEIPEEEKEEPKVTTTLEDLLAMLESSASPSPSPIIPTLPSFEEIDVGSPSRWWEDDLWESLFMNGPVEVTESEEEVFERDAEEDETMVISEPEGDRETTSVDQLMAMLESSAVSISSSSSSCSSFPMSTSSSSREEEVIERDGEEDEVAESTPEKPEDEKETTTVDELMAM